ncbi:MAG: hypothetical protein ACRYHQ_31590 [Janthinobacterium lividum]
MTDADRAALAERAQSTARGMILLDGPTFAHRLTMLEGVLFADLTGHGHTPADALAACSIYADAARAERERLAANDQQYGGMQ